MTSLDEVCLILDLIGIPWANERFDEDEQPAPPYICLQAGFGDAAYADDAAYIRWMEYEILLYTRERAYDIEERIGAALDGIGCGFEKTITHYDGERLIEASFTVYLSEERGRFGNA